MEDSVGLNDIVVMVSVWFGQWRVWRGVDAVRVRS